MFRTHHQPFTHTRIPTDREATPQYIRKLRDSQVARKNGYGYKQTVYFPLSNNKREYRLELQECRDVQEAIERNDRNARLSSAVTTNMQNKTARQRSRKEYEKRASDSKRQLQEIDAESDREDAQLNRYLKKERVPVVRGARNTEFQDYDEGDITHSESEPEEVEDPQPPYRRRPPPQRADDRPSKPREARGLGDRTVQDQAAIQNAIEMLRGFGIDVPMANGGMQIRSMCRQIKVDSVRSAEGTSRRPAHSRSRPGLNFQSKSLLESAVEFRSADVLMQCTTREEVWEEWNDSAVTKRCKRS
jgi:hypothetical protein